MSRTLAFPSDTPAAHSQEIRHPQVGAARAEPLVAAAVLFLLGVRQSVVLGATIGFLAALITFPMWIRVVDRYRWARVIIFSGVLAAIFGAVLSRVAAADHVVLRHAEFATTFLLLEIVFGIGVVLWARNHFPAWAVGVFFAAGMFVNTVLRPGVLAGSNPLKFAWLVPLGVLVFSLVSRSANLVLQLVALGAVALLAVVADARAFFGTALVAGVLVAWQLRPRVLGVRTSWVWTAGFLAALAVAAYNLVASLLIDGYLGSDAQARSIQQVDASGNLLLGGRPELSATWALLHHYPLGFGPGVVATLPQINVAKAGMKSINYDPNNGYVDRFMFGSAVELHSAFGDLWAAFGPVGILFSLLVVASIVVCLSRLIAGRVASAVVTFFALWSLWNMLFSPLLSTAPTLLLGLGLLYAESPRPSGDDDDDQPAASGRAVRLGQLLSPRYERINLR